MNERNALYKELKALNLEIETEAGWYEKNRSLSKGDRGEDVGRLQKQLNANENTKLKITNIYDDATVTEIKNLQRRQRLKEDGIAGPVTQAVLFQGYYRYRISKPPKVQQEIWTCWAAAFESALPSWTGRPKHKIAYFVEKYKKYLKTKKDITPDGFDVVVKDLNAVSGTGPENGLLELVKEMLLYYKSHLIIVTGTPVAHCRVIYGIGVFKGEPTLWVMDPLWGDYKPVPIDFTGDITLVHPKK